MPPTDGFRELVKRFTLLACVFFVGVFFAMGFGLLGRVFGARGTGTFVMPPPTLGRGDRKWSGNAQEHSAEKAEEYSFH